LSNKLNATFRLPTEAEWEYACRADTTTPFNTGVNLTSDQANYKGECLDKTALVGSYPPNGWGVYDMHGNVWEWCSDWYGEEYYNECNQQGIIVNPQGPPTGSFRVLRGGGYDEYVEKCRSAYRSFNGSDSYDDDISFRLVFIPT
jgi:sulfatase modifying factor 1